MELIDKTPVCSINVVEKGTSGDALSVPIIRLPFLDSALSIRKHARIKSTKFYKHIIILENSSLNYLRHSKSTLI
jgi:hypothetical protein